LELPTKLLIAIHDNYGYLPAWTYLLKIYRKRFQFASKSIIYNDAFPLFCGGHLKRQHQPLRVPPDATFRLQLERSFRPLPELVGQEGKALEQQQHQRQRKEEGSLHRLAEGSFPN
jgi:hypothetical protein